MSFIQPIDRHLIKCLTVILILVMANLQTLKAQTTYSNVKSLFKAGKLEEARKGVDILIKKIESAPEKETIEIFALRGYIYNMMYAALKKEGQSKYSFEKAFSMLRESINSFSICLEIDSTGDHVSGTKRSLEITSKMLRHEITEFVQTHRKNETIRDMVNYYEIALKGAGLYSKTKVDALEKEINEAQNNNHVNTSAYEPKIFSRDSVQYFVDNKAYDSAWAMLSLVNSSPVLHPDIYRQQIIVGYYLFKRNAQNETSWNYKNKAENAFEVLTKYYPPIDKSLVNMYEEIMLISATSDSLKKIFEDSIQNVLIDPHIMTAKEKYNYLFPNDLVTNRHKGNKWIQEVIVRTCINLLLTDTLVGKPYLYYEQALGALNILKSQNTDDYAELEAKLSYLRDSLDEKFINKWKTSNEVGELDLVSYSLKAYQLSYYSKAKEFIESAMVNERFKNHWKVWYCAGYIFKDQFKITQENQYRGKAMKSYYRSIELADDSSIIVDSKKAIIYLASTLYNDGVSLLDSFQFEQARIHFDEYFLIQRKIYPERNLDNRIIEVNSYFSSQYFKSLTNVLDYDSAFAAEIEISFVNILYVDPTNQSAIKALIEHRQHVQQITSATYQLKERENKLTKAENKQHEIEAQQQRQQTYFLYGGLGLALLLGGFIFNRFRITSKQKGIIEEQKYQVDKAFTELEEKNTEILDSINYAKRIQSAILPPNKLVKEFLQESFILYKPKDIVAGDFYWMEPTKEGVLFAAADCTGHGVPGAMVSVVCNNGLNRSVREQGLKDPGQILDKTREIVISEFEKSEEEVKDGMDIALCSLQGTTLKYAGAHNPLWIIRKDSQEVEEIKANKQPIGKFDEPLPYTTHTLALNEGDSFYIFSDGYADQFGGEKGKKLKAKNFKTLLLSMQNETMEKQRELIDEAFETWKGTYEQLDDVCVIGVRI